MLPLNILLTPPLLQYKISSGSATRVLLGVQKISATVTLKAAASRARSLRSELMIDAAWLALAAPDVTAFKLCQV